MSVSLSLSLSHTHTQTESPLQGFSHTLSVISHPVLHTHSHPQTRSLSLTHGVFLPRSVLHSRSPTLLESPSRSRSLLHASVTLRHALTRSGSHVPPPTLLRVSGPASRTRRRRRREAGPTGCGPGWPRPGYPGAPASGPLPHGGQSPPGCSVALPPRPRGCSSPAPATSPAAGSRQRAASGQGARLRAGLTGGGASGPQGPPRPQGSGGLRSGARDAVPASVGHAGAQLPPLTGWLLLTLHRGTPGLRGTQYGDAPAERPPRPVPIWPLA